MSKPRTHQGNDSVFISLFANHSIAQDLKRAVIHRYAQNSMAKAKRKGDNTFQARLALSEQELHYAFCLLYREYRNRGLCRPNNSQVHFSQFNLLPSTRTQVLMWNNSVCGTASIYHDSTIGIPLEQLYADEVEDFRQKGKRVAEIGSLALDTEMFWNGGTFKGKSIKYKALMTLFFAIYQDAHRNSNTTDFLIVVHPQHERIYKPLGFSRFADVRSYKGACGKPAVPLHVTRDVLSDAIKRLKLERFQDAAPKVNPFELSPETVAYFCSLRPDIAPPPIWEQKKTVGA